jgi:hypothetical protein
MERVFHSLQIGGLTDVPVVLNPPGERAKLSTGVCRLPGSLIDLSDRGHQVSTKEYRGGDLPVEREESVQISAAYAHAEAIEQLGAFV